MKISRGEALLDDKNKLVYSLPTHEIPHEEHQKKTKVKICTQGQ
jgi:hypothetical protein